MRSSSTPRADKFTWNTPREAHSGEYIAAKYTHDDGDGRKYQLDNMTSPNPRPNMMYEWKGFSYPVNGWRYSKETMTRLDAEGRIYYPLNKDGSFNTNRRPRFKRYLDEMQGQIMGSVWTDISPVNSQARERLGYPTQKPVALLDRIIGASSNVSDVVFDPFCGCGTTIYSAVKNERKWIGCDIAILAVRLIREVLMERYHLIEGTHFEVDGIPVSVEQAEALFQKNPFQFQHWALERIGGFPMQKKVADKGIDGRIYFETQNGLRDMVLSVKGGTIRPTDIRDLRGVLEREDGSALAGFISMREPTKAMRDEAAHAGMFEYGGLNYARIQLLTIREVLEEKREFHTPTKIGIRDTTGRGTTAQQNLPLR